MRKFLFVLAIGFLVLVSGFAKEKTTSFGGYALHDTDEDITYYGLTLSTDKKIGSENDKKYNSYITASLTYFTEMRQGSKKISYDEDYKFLLNIGYLYAYSMNKNSPVDFRLGIGVVNNCYVRYYKYDSNYSIEHLGVTSSVEAVVDARLSYNIGKFSLVAAASAYYPLYEYVSYVHKIGSTSYDNNYNNYIEDGDFSFSGTLAASFRF